MHEEFISLQNSISLFVRDSKGSNTAVLFLHFGSGNSYIWDGIIPYFKESFRIIAPDLRGHGKSDKPESGYHIDEMANDIFLLLKELDVDKCHIIGSSLGAEVAVSFASIHKDMVLSLVCEGALYNEFGEYGLFNGSNEEIIEEKKKRFANILERKQPIYNSREELIEEEKKSLEKEEMWNQYFKKYIENNICQTTDGKFTYCYPLFVSKQYTKNYWEFKFEKYYKEIDCPVLFMPSDKEWKDSKIKNIIYNFANFLDSYCIKLVEGSMHAYVWMQFPQIAGKIAYEFIKTNSN